jgi:hypothetical protein
METAGEDRRHATLTPALSHPMGEGESSDAAGAFSASGVTKGHGDSETAAWKSALRALLWPCPQAWAGLAGAWCLVLLLHLTAGTSDPNLAGRQAPAPGQVRMAFEEQRRLLADLGLPPHSTPKPPSSPVVPRPRSSRSPGFTLA